MPYYRTKVLCYDMIGVDRYCISSVVRDCNGCILFLDDIASEFLNIRCDINCVHYNIYIIDGLVYVHNGLRFQRCDLPAELEFIFKHISDML